MATKADVLREFKWYIDNGGYHEKKNGTAKYLTDTLANFSENAGSANYTYMGKLCGINPGAWCAMMVSTAVYKACGKDSKKAKDAMWGVWPYTSCNQIWDAAPDNKKFWSDHQRFKLGKGSRTRYIPHKGDVIVFTDNTVVRSHTGQVYDVDDKYVYTYEGNSGNMARKRSYLLTSAYIYGYIQLNLPDGEEVTDVKENYGKEITIKTHTLSKGCAGVEVERYQMMLNGMGITDDGGNPLKVDGDFGKCTEQATKRLQKRLFPNAPSLWDGIAGTKTFDGIWNRRLDE